MNEEEEYTGEAQVDEFVSGDAATRRRWLADFPDDEMPPHEELPYDRDRHLPQAHSRTEPDESDELM